MAVVERTLAVVQAFDEILHFEFQRLCGFHLRRPHVAGTIAHHRFVDGYLSLIMKNGVFIALIFYSILLFFYSKSIYNVYRVRTNIYSKELTEYVLIPFGVMTVLLVSSITAGQFYSREGGLAFSLCFALISIADNGTLMLNTKTITNNDISS